MRDVLGKMWECGKYIKMRDFPHDCGMVDTYEFEMVQFAELWMVYLAGFCGNYHFNT